MHQTTILEDGSEILVIHYLYRSPKGTMGAEGQPIPGASTETDLRIACSPNMVDFSANAFRGFPVKRTEESGAVTCPLCKETPYFKRALEQVEAAKRIRARMPL